MGCCFTICCCDDSKSQSGDSDERSRLISDPVINSSDGQRIPSEAVVSPYQQSLPSKSDEQTMLNKILQQTAINVIDISTLGPHMMEQNEYLERRAAYTSRIESVNQLRCGNRPDSSQLQDTPFPEKLFNMPEINNEDYILIKVSAARVKDAITNLKVNRTEDLVIPFHIPQKRVVLPSSNSNTHINQNSDLVPNQG